MRNIKANKFPKYYIYKITFKSGKTYIGQHVQNVETDSYITSSKYYKNNPSDKIVSREILLYVDDRDTLDILETIAICYDKADNYKKNVNHVLGGWMSSIKGGWNKGIPCSEEHKRKTFESLKGRKPWNKGKHLSEKHKRKISENSTHGKPNLGRKVSKEVREKMSKAHKGKPHSKEWNEKVRQANLGKKVSKETRRKISLAKKGKKQSKETVEKRRKSQIGQFWWTNGKEERKSKKCPSKGWVRGRLNSKISKEKLKNTKRKVNNSLVIDNSIK